LTAAKYPLCGICRDFDQIGAVEAEILVGLGLSAGDSMIDMG
jgi:hypothetical protein